MGQYEDKKNKLRSLQKDFFALHNWKKIAENIKIFVARQKQICHIFLSENIACVVKIVDIEEQNKFFIHITF